MQQTAFKNFTLPAAPAGATPIAKAGARPMRVVVLNNDPAVVVAWGTDEQAVAQGTSQTFLLPPLTSVVYVLAPRQHLFAQPVGAAPAVVSMSASEAIPGETI